MRRDVDPDDFEYEPTAHDAVLARATAHEAGEKAGDTVQGQEGTGAGK